ncbi:nitrogen regulatory P-II family protein [Paraburkholderia fungorum]|jgi:nitrogen regulatory protein P-II 1|uniref:Nitrogen regulatory P-II family protein n=1 Tax=Paraburkholderia fungorum TaxID=134537 RepID=A0AAP5UXY1_9BURK|nr:P-II family nitrogen regulator [Paraburkholderia fungorum]AJZ57148.1 nitrogen regulatory P-II family protein [Paraburkholderia fungorum]MDT8843480.1 P-II family nitrogen regulator [Paraburkholderia fungorum]PRZ45516.1 nitrogen regulatory protein P-II family [Paraburkholderia fungorum]
MEIRCVVAIVRSDVLERLEKRLGAIHVHGVTVSRVKGFGEHPNYFSNDWTTDHIKIEIFTREANVDALIAEITAIAHTGAGGDGVIAVLPAERFLRIGTSSEVMP